MKISILPYTERCRIDSTDLCHGCYLDGGIEIGRLIDEEDAINAILREYNKDDSDFPTDYQLGLSAAKKIIEQLPSAQPEPCLDLIVSEIEETIRETRENGKHHEINVRTNGAMICFGLQLALEIINEKRNERSDIQAVGD